MYAKKKKPDKKIAGFLPNVYHPMISKRLKYTLKN
jgi:hypothetical protein